MRKTFIETTAFSAMVTEKLPDEGLNALQLELLSDPNKGEVLPGCGGLRKLRTPDPKRGKGKRGGARVIYLHIPEAGVIYLLDLYGKDEKDDLASREKSMLKELSEQLKIEAIRKAKRKKRARGTTS